MLGAELHRILIVSDAPIGGLLTAMLEAEDREVDVVESYGRYDAMYAKLARQTYDVVVLTNTTLLPPHILNVVPEIRLRFSSVSIVVLSGWLEGDFASSLERLNVHDAFKMPEDTKDAVWRISELVAEQSPLPRPTES